MDSLKSSLMELEIITVLNSILSYWSARISWSLYPGRSVYQNKINLVEVWILENKHSGPETPAEPCPLQTFLSSKKRQGKQRQKRKSLKTETVKRLSPRSKCYCFSHSRVSRIQNFFLSANHGGRQYFSLFHGPTTLKPISLALTLT